MLTSLNRKLLETLLRPTAMSLRATLILMEPGKSISRRTKDSQQSLNSVPLSTGSMETVKMPHLSITRKKMDAFKLIGEPIRARHYYYGELDVYYAQWDKVSTVVKDKLGVIDHLTDEQKETINKKHTSTENMIAAVKADKASKQLYENPAYTLDQIIAAIESCKRETENIFNLPPPKVEKPEAGSSEKKGEDAPADAEMKDEQPKEEAK